MTQLTANEAAQFAQRWLPAWTGNDPQRLAYFRKLLANNPHWVWTQLEAIPMQEGKIRRNEVYFDRTDLLAEIARYRQSR